MHSAMDSAVCVGTFSVLLLIISCVSLAVLATIKCCADAVGEVPSAAPRLLL